MPFKLKLLDYVLFEAIFVSFRYGFFIVFLWCVTVCLAYCSIEDARRLADLVQGIPCKINLISFNPHSGSHFRPTSDEKMIEFRNCLAEARCVVFLRPSRGDDQMAACGQLGKPGEIQAPILRVPEKFKTATQVAV